MLAPERAATRPSSDHPACHLALHCIRHRTRGVLGHARMLDFWLSGNVSATTEDKESKNALAFRTRTKKKPNGLNERLKRNMCQTKAKRNEAPILRENKTNNEMNFADHVGNKTEEATTTWNDGWGQRGNGWRLEVGARAKAKGGGLKQTRLHNKQNEHRNEKRTRAAARARSYRARAKAPREVRSPKSF